MGWKVLGVGIYLLVLIAIGVLASRRTKDTRDYFAGGKRLGFWAVAFSSRATGESAWLLIGLTGMGAAYGVHAFFVVLGEVLGVAGAWLLLSRRFHRLTMRYDSITVPDYLEARFRDSTHALRIVAALTLVVFVTCYVAAQIDATGKAFDEFLDTGYTTGALFGFAVVLAYSVAGGFLAVVWSDVFQGSLMLFGLVALPLAGLAAVGGPAELTERLRAIDPNLLAWSRDVGGWSAASVWGAVGLALIGLGFLGSPQIFVRFLALRSESEIGRGAGVALTWTLLADSGAVLVGMVGRALLTEPGGDLEAALGASAEGVLPALVETVMPPFLVGLYIAIVLAAIMSTVDSLLVVAGSAAVRDYWQKVRHPELSDRDLLRIGRPVTLALALVALAVALGVASVAEGDASVFWFVVFGWSGIAATFCPTMILSLFWSGTTRRGALAAMLAGAAGVPLFKFSAPHWPIVGDTLATVGELPPAFLVSFLCGALVSLGDPRGRARLSEVASELDEAGR